MTSAPAIGFEYRPSRWPRRFFGLIAALAVLALWLSAPPLWLKIILTVSVSLALVRASWQFAHPEVQSAGWIRDGGWSLRMASGEDSSATLASFRILGERAIWLHLAAPGRGSIALLLAPDNSDADIRRRLRMRLALSMQENQGTLSPPRGPTV